MSEPKKVKVESVIVNPGGKGAAVRRSLPSGEIVNICECRYNADFSRGCIGMVDVSLLQEAIDNHGKYAPGNLDKYKAADLTNNKCTYCYAYSNTGNILPRKVNEKTRASFLEHEPDVIRIGKLTEPGHPYYHQTLMAFLDLCCEYGSALIFPNKMLAFGIDGVRESQERARDKNSVNLRLAQRLEMASGEVIAKKLRDTHSTLLYSLGWDSEEKGAVSQGFTNDWRINQALAYSKAGVNTSLTIVCDVTSSIEENHQRGSPIKRALGLKDCLNVRLLPLRPKAKNMPIICGGSREELRGDATNPPLPGMGDLLHIAQPHYAKRGNQEDYALVLHSDFQELKEQGMGICGTVGETEYCDKCNLEKYSKEESRVEFPASEIPPIDYSNKKGKKNKLGKQKKLQLEEKKKPNPKKKRSSKKTEKKS